MNAELQSRGREAIRAIDAVLRAGPEADHATIRAAANGVIAFRNEAILAHRDGTLAREKLDGANALTSLAYGAEFPLSGLHLRRMQETRDGLQALIASGAA